MSFFNILFSNIAGLLIGLFIAIILSLVLGFTAFKGNKIVATFITILLCVAFMFAGVFVQNFIYNKSINTDPLSPNYDVFKDPNVHYIDPNYDLSVESNGGFDRTYIEEQLTTAETTEDKYFNIGMTEYNEIVIFYYNTIINNEQCTVNIVMQKINENLCFDGCLNVYVDFGGWWLNKLFNKYDYTYINEMNKGNNFTPLNYRLNSDHSIHYYTRSHEPALSILSNGAKSALGYNSEANKCAQAGNNLILNNYFEQLGDLGIILDSGDILKQLNNFYTSIYNSVKKSGIDNPSVDVTNSCAYYNKEEEKFYKANLFLNVKYKFFNQDIYAIGTWVNDQVLDDFKDQVDDIVADKVVGVYVKFILTPGASFSMNGFNIEESPVVITLKNSDNSYVINFDTKTKFAQGIEKNILLGEYSVEIESRVLSIGNTANITIDKTSSVFALKYTYEQNTVLVSVGLSPLSYFITDDLDLSQTPVVITLNNGVSSYKFNFNSNELLNEKITLRLPMGKYTYSITSTELTFSQMSGDLNHDIDVNHCIFTFFYDYKTNVEYELTISNSTNNVYGGLIFKLESIPFDKSQIKDITLFIIANVDSYMDSYSWYKLASGEINDFTSITNPEKYNNKLCRLQLLISLKNGDKIVTNLCDYTVPDLTHSGIILSFTVTKK